MPSAIRSTTSSQLMLATTALPLEPAVTSLLAGRATTTSSLSATSFTVTPPASKPFPLHIFQWCAEPLQQQRGRGVHGSRFQRDQLSAPRDQPVLDQQRRPDNHRATDGPGDGRIFRQCRGHAVYIRPADLLWHFRTDLRI